MPTIPSFSYNVTRDYPYKWFTPVAIVGGILLATLFSAINFFSTAYNMVSVTTDAPHDIEAGAFTNSYAHFFASKIQPKCDDAVLSIGSRFRTNQSLFEYQLVGLGTMGPAMSYHDEVIDGCHTTGATLEFSTWYDRPANQINTSAWGLSVAVNMECFIDGHDTHEPKYFTLQTLFDPIEKSENDIYASSPSWEIDPLSSAASRWAQVLMVGFWDEVVTAMTNQTDTSLGLEDTIPQHNLTHGYVQLESWNYRDRTKAITDDDYFDRASWVFFDAAKSKRYTGLINTLDQDYVHSTTWPIIWGPVDRLAKAVLSAVYLDLGTFPSTHSSMVSSADTLRHWTQNLTSITNHSSVNMGLSILNQDVWIADYDTAQSLPITDTHKLGALPETPTSNTFTRATISTAYLCQQARLKPPFDIFISILVADLVFLRAAWSLYNFIVGYILKSRHADANICDECVARKNGNEQELKAQPYDNTKHGNKQNIFDEHTVELDDVDVARSASLQHEDQQSMQRLLTLRHV